MELPWGVSVSSLGQMLSQQASCYGNTRTFTFLNKNLESVSVLGFDELRVAALRIASSLSQTCKQGARVILLLPAGRDFVMGIYGCWMAGLVPVPALPPEGVSRKLALPRLRRVIEDCGSDLVLSTANIWEGLSSGESSFLQSCQWMDVETCATADPCEMRPVGLDDLALIQYTSGSTSAPKGVALTHRNMLANAATMQRTLGLDSNSRGLLWLPPHHDMGLMGGIVEPVFAGFPIYLMTPAAFLQRPERWLSAISRYRITVSGAPDFAYRLAAAKRDTIGQDAIDLSCWRVAFCGAEKVRPHTIETFLEAFEPLGFSPSAFIPCYGLAEATLMVAARRAGQGRPRVRAVDVDRLADGLVAPMVPEGRSISLVSCGPAAELCEVAIVAPGKTVPLGENMIGEVLCGGPGIAGRYWTREDAPQAALGTTLDGRDNRFIRTGDLGFLADGELYLTGRLQDLIVINGRNCHPEDLEATLEIGLADRGVPVGAACVIAVGEHDEDVIACVELTVRVRPDDSVLETATSAAFDLVSRGHGVRLARVLLLPRGAIPRTTSGKVQRSALRRDLAEYEAKAFADKPSAADGGNAVASIFEPPADDRVAPRDIAEWLSRKICEKLGLAMGSVSPTRPLTELGLSSVDAVTLTGELGDWLNRDIPATFVFDHPTIEKLATALAGERGPQPADALSARSSAQIAIVGIGCRMPGAEGLQDFWRALLERAQPIRTAPPTRPNAARLDATGHEAGYLDGVESFDSAFFRIPPDEAALMDPQQRALLEVSWHALESAGLPPERLRGSAVGVFVGISNSDYGRLVASSQDVSPFVGTGNSFAVAANRLSYWYDFTGPSLAVDTACSSSLAAVHLACRALRAGECEVALAGGVNLILGDELTQAFANAGMLSPDSRCHSFIDQANGYVRGEGCAMVALKPIEAAQRDGDRIYAVIHGSAMNQDGQSNGLTAPSADAQSRCIRTALADAGVDSGEIGYVEAHGTGTPLGDPVEVRGIASAYASTARPPCTIGTIKANIGHLEAAAGVAGLIKTALVLNHDRIPPHAATGELNPRLAMPAWLSVAPFDEAKPLAARFAAVSSFGFGGTNVHVVLGRPPARVAETIPPIGTPILIRVSARTARDRAALATGYADAIETGGWAAAVAISRASLARRERLACSSWPIADNPESCVRALRAIASGEDSYASVETSGEKSLIWVCGHMDDPDRFIQGFAQVFPILPERFASLLAADPAQSPAVAAHRALFEAFRSCGVLPNDCEGNLTSPLMAAVPPLGRDATSPADAMSSSPGRPIAQDGSSDPRQIQRVLVGDPVGSMGQTEAVLDPATPLRSALCCLALADAAGHRVDWVQALRSVAPGLARMPAVDLPSYPFARTRHWYTATAPTVEALTLEWAAAVTPLPAVDEASCLIVGDATLLADDADWPDGQRVAGADRGSASISEAIERIGVHPVDRVILVVPSLRPEDLPSFLASVVQLGVACAGAAGPVRPELRIVTTGALQPGNAESALHAAVWGLGRTMANELPELYLQLVDLAPDRSDASLALLRRCLGTRHNPHLSIRDGRAYTPSIVPYTGKAAPALRGDPDELIVISGGMGKLGGAIAKALFDLGFRRFAVLGRRIVDWGASLDDIERAGATVRRFALDVADLVAVQTLFRKDLASERITGIVHAAGVLSDTPLHGQREMHFAACLAPKAIGFLNLIAASADRELRFIAATSSLSGQLGNPGQASYAAANACLDGCVHTARRNGVAATSFLLGMVADGGMPVDALSGANPLELQAIDADAAASEIVRQLGGPAPWVALTARGEAALDPALVPEWVYALTCNWLTYRQGATRAALRLAIEAEPGRAKELLTRWLTESVAQALHISPDEVFVDKGLVDQGLTSVAILQLRMQLQRELDVVLDPPAFFDHPTVGRLSVYLAGLIGPAASPVIQPVMFQRDLPGDDDPFSETEAVLDAILRPHPMRMAQ